MQIVVTAMPVPIMNGVWVVGQEADSETVDAGLNMVKDAKVPFCLQARPGWRAQGALIAKARQMVEFEEVPLMAVTGPVAADAPEDLSIRRLAPDEALLHCEIAGKAFGATTELFAQLMTDSVMRLRELRVYVGEVHGQWATTALSITVGDAVGIFNVATPEEHRRRGYGAAITGHAVADGLAAGARWSWLQSSPEGYGVYERLGFVTLERWPCWISP